MDGASSEHVIMDEAAQVRRPRKCFWIPAEPHDEHGWVPSVVVEGQPGHAPLAGRGKGSSPWYWGKTYEEAQATARRENAALGITPEEATEIVLSSMIATPGTMLHRLAQDFLGRDPR